MSTVHPLLFCRRSSWSVRPTLQKLSTAFREDTPSCPAPPTAAWWGSTPSPGSCPSTSPSPRRPIRVRLYCLFNDLATTMKAFKRFLPLLLIVSLLDGLDRFWLDFSSLFFLRHLFVHQINIPTSELDLFCREIIISALKESHANIWDIIKENWQNLIQQNSFLLQNEMNN